MDITEMRQREAFQEILVRTLQRAWSREQGRQVVIKAAGAQGQCWRHHLQHNAYTVAGVGPVARAFLADSIRNTTRRWRRPLQWVAGTALSSPVGLRFRCGEGFVVDPPLERADELVLLPGNQRIRLFDFGTGRTRVYAKEGFSNTLMAREIALRTGGEGPFPAITAHDESALWFEEPIVEGWCLARCPARVDPAEAVEAALAGLDAWTARGARQVDATAYMEGLAERVRVGLAVLAERYGHDVTPWDPWLAALVERASGGELAIGPSHGDCQYGNLMVSRSGEGRLIDWEHQGERWVHYDRMVLALEARRQAGLPGRMLAYMRGGRLEWHPEQAAEPDWRRVAIARYLLEDSVFQVEEAARERYQRVTQGLCEREEGMRTLGPGLAALWRA